MGVAVFFGLGHAHMQRVTLISVLSGMPAVSAEESPMKAAVYYQPGGPEVLRYEEVPDPQIGAHDVLVEVEAISIEGGDTMHRSAGDAGSADQGPHIVGYQCAGTVRAAGAEVTRVRPGDRVVTVGLDGSHAELRAVPELVCWPIPPQLDTRQAACVP